MTCGDVSKFIQAYLDNDFSAEIEKEWHQHLEDCSACREHVQSYKKCLALMRRFMRDECPPKRLRERLKQRLGYDCFDCCDFTTRAHNHESDKKEKPL